MPLYQVGIARTVAALREALPPTHLAFLKAMELYHTIGDFTFVHAGLRPGRPLGLQLPNDLTEIREPFLKHAGDFGAFIVHGHTPVAKVDIRPNRINLDTGAYATGRLSCLIIERDSLALTSSAR